MRKGKYYNTKAERDEFRAFLLSEYNDGKTTGVIGKEIGLSKDAVWKQLKKTNTIMRGGRTTRGRREKIILALTPKGLTLKKIGEIAGVHESTVSEVQKRHGVYKKKDPINCKVTNCTIKHHAGGFCNKHWHLYKKIKEDLVRGLTRGEIFHKRPSASRGFINEYFHKNRHHKINPHMILMLYDCGASLREIAEIYGCHRSTIGNLLKKMGMKLRSQGGANHLIYKGKNIPCSRCDGIAANTSAKTGKPVCRTCHGRHGNHVRRRNEIWNQINNEHRVGI